VSKRLHNPIESVLNLTVVDDNELLQHLNAVYGQIVNNPSCLGPNIDIAGFQDTITRYAAAASPCAIPAFESFGHGGFCS
jgi:hypothetical protein